MKNLTLLRHAKSSWKDPDLDDFDRPLNGRGQRDAPMMARRLAGRIFEPDLVLGSPALRIRQTLEVFVQELNIDPAIVIFDERIYLAEVEDLIDLVRGIPDDRCRVLLVGHNPGLTELANYLTGDELENLPTCALYGTELPVSAWGRLEQEVGKLLFYDYPKKMA